MIKLLPYIYLKKIHIYFSSGNGQPREPALRQLYRHTFVRCALQLCTVVSSPAMTGDERVSECVDLYSAQSLRRIPNAPDALVAREQVRFK